MSYHSFGAVPSIEPGTAEVEDILCPSGWAIKAEGEKIWCEDNHGNKHPPAYQPSTKLSTESTMGVMGWSLIAAGAMVLGAMVLGSKRRARPNRRRRAKSNDGTTKVWHGSTYPESDFMRLKRCREQLTRLREDG